MKIDILGTKIDALTQQQALEKIESFFNPQSSVTGHESLVIGHQIITANPEIVLAAKKNKKYQDLINNASLVLADGIGLLWAAKFLSLKSNSWLTSIIQAKFSLLSLIFCPSYYKEILPERITGVDLMEKICERAAQKNWKIYLLGAGEGIAQKTAEVLKKRYHNLNIVGAASGPTIQDTRYKSQETKNIQDAITNIQTAAPDILFVAMGSPKQDFFINSLITNHQSPITNLKLAMGVGGAFDFISGQAKRAPAIFRNLGLEWLYRFFHQPWRAIRIFNATIRFIWNVVIYKKLKIKN